MAISDQQVIYIQYTNPAGYPPLEHSSRILADAGCNVLFLGTGAFGADSLTFPQHIAIEVRRFATRGDGLRQKLDFVAFIVWVTATCRKRKPTWIYASLNSG